VPCMAGGLAEWLRHFNDLAVGETAAPACFSRENAEGAGMPSLLSHWNDRTRRHRSEAGEHTPWTRTSLVQIMDFQKKTTKT